jgi:hypothetical protein
MGANIAADIAKGELSEATIGYNVLQNAQLLKVGLTGRHGLSWCMLRPSVCALFSQAALCLPACPPAACPLAT